MAGYSLEVRKSAAKEIAALPKKECRAIIEKIQALAREPRPHRAEKLSGDDKYRIRHRDYRIVHEIDDEAKRVTIARVAHRREVLAGPRRLRRIDLPQGATEAPLPTSRRSGKFNHLTLDGPPQAVS